MPEPLSHANEQYRHYGYLAASRQRLYRGGRLLVLVLGLGAASAGAARISLPDAAAALLPILDGAATVLPLLAAGLGLFIWAFHLARNWVAFRAGAEAVKAEAFLYATSAEKYSTEDRNTLLNRRLAEIGRTVERIRRGEDDKDVAYTWPGIQAMVEKPPKDSFPEGPLGAEDYLRLRLEDQLAYYLRRAGEHHRVALLFLILTVATSVGTSVLGYFHVDAWVAVMTTLSGSLSAYSAVRADDFLASSYRSTARQLVELGGAWRNHEHGADLPAFAAQVEQVLLREHGGWTALVRHLSAGEIVPQK